MADEDIQSAVSTVLAQTDGVSSAGQSLQLGGRDYGTIEDGGPVEFAAGSNFTLSFWVKPSADSDKDAWIMRQGSSWGVQWVGTGEERKIRFQADGFNDNIKSNGGVQAGVWTHVAIVYDGNNRIIYLNGDEDKTLSGSDGPNTNNNQVRFGANDAGNGQFFAGQVDNVRFWNTDRSLIEIENDQYVELDGSESGLDHLYQFDGDASDGPGTDAAGSSDIVLTGSEIVDGDSNPVAPHVHARPQNGSAAIDLVPRNGPVGENDANEFRLYRSTSPDSSTASLVATLDPSTTSYTDSAVSNGGTYFYWATAVDDDGEGDFSKAASVSPYGKTEESVETGEQLGGQGGDSLALDGRSWGTLSDRASLDRATGSNFATEFWVKPSADSDEDAWILRKQGSWGVQWTGTGEERRIYFQADGFNDGITSNGGVQAGVWTHVAIVYDGSNRNIYLNGELDKSSSGADGPGANSNDLIIGSNGANNGQFFKGEVDDLRFWESSRESSQIEQNYTEELVGSESGLVGYWQFDTSEDSGGATRGSTFRHGTVTLNSDATISDGGAYPVGTDTYVHSRNGNATVTWSVRTDSVPDEFAVWRKGADAGEAGWGLLERIENNSVRTYVDESASNGENYHYAVTAIEDGQEGDFPRGAPARPYESRGGAALSLDGSQDTRGLVTDRSSLGDMTGSEFTTEFWVKPDADSDENAWIMRKKGAWGVKWVGTGEERKINFQADGFNDGITSNGGVQAGVWTHVAIVYDGNNRNIYLNGKLDKRSGGADGPGTSGNDLSIGVNDAGNDRFFVGRIDEIALWDTPRTSDQIEASYNDRLTGNESGLRHYWQFDEQGADASRSTTGRHATVDVQGQAAVESPGAMPVTPDVYARADDGSVDVSWRVRNLAETVDVGLYRATQRDLGDRTQIATVDAVRDSRYTDSGLSNGQTRFYQATAFNTDGQESDYAFEAGALPSAQTSGNAFELLGNASSSYGTHTDRPSIDRALGNELATEFWVNPDADSDQDAWILRKQGAWGVQWTGTGDQRKIKFQADGFHDNIKSNSNVTAGEWTHVAIVYDGNNRNIYLNGELDKQSSGSDGPTTSGNDLTIGSNGAHNAQFFQGDLDELRIWDGSRSKSEISRNYDNELAGSDDDLVGYWRGPFTTDNESVTGNARKPMTLGLNNVEPTDSRAPVDPGGVDTTTVDVALECAPNGLIYYQIRLNATSGEPIRSIESGPEFDFVGTLEGGPGASSVTAYGEFSADETTFSDRRVLFSVEYEGAVEETNTELEVQSLRGGDGEITDCDVSTTVGEPQSPVENESPNAVAAANPSTASVGETIEFDAFDSTDSDGSIESYEWDFGDGSTGQGESTTHSYSSAGTYEATLTVTDDDGATDTDTVTVTVESDGTDDGETDATVQRIGFDYGQYGGNLNLEVNGDRVFDINSFSASPPDGVNGDTIGGASVSVTTKSSTSGELGHVEITGDIESFSVGGQEMWIDNVEFGSSSNPDANVTFTTLNPNQSSYALGDTFTSDGVDVEVISFIYSDGTDCSTTQFGCGSGSQYTTSPANSGGTAPDFYPGNVNLRFNLSTITDTPDDGDGTDEEGLSATRDIASTTVPAGESTEVTVTAQAAATTSDLGVIENIDSSLSATVVNDDGATTSAASDTQVTASWGGVSEVTLTYEVTIPETAENGQTFTISGTVEDNEAGTQATTSGDTTIEVGERNPVAEYANENGVVKATGLLNAAADFRNGEIGATTLLDVAAAFRSGTPVT